ncbi:STY0301 family protein [Oxalobacteraceae bacterium A2-2]
MKAHWSVGIMACLWMAPAAPGATTSSFDCPKSIEQKSIHISGTPPGWNTYVDAPLYLHSAAPMSGPPEQLGELVDFKQTQGKGYWTHIYQLDGKFSQGKWLVCSYGESDQVKLSKKLADHIQSCSFTFRKGKYVGQNDVRIECR